MFYPNKGFVKISTLIWEKKNILSLKIKKKGKNIHFSFRRERLLELVRVESVAVIPYAQFVSAAKVAENVLSRKHMSWLRALYVFTKLRIGKSKIRACHID